MTARLVILSFLSLFILSACENSRVAKYNPFGQGPADASSVDNVQMRADTGEVTPMPSYQSARGTTEGYNPITNSSVDIFMTDQMSASTSSPRYTGGTMPMYNNGVPSSGDSSVTIFSLEGAAPMNNGYDSSGFNHNAGSYSNSADNQIFFKHGSSRLGGGDKRELGNVAEQAKFAPVNRVTVAGYASPPTQVGSQSVQADILNLKESMNRSFVVAKDLMKKGVPAEKIKTVSWGATKPTGSNSKDRRVDVIMGEQ